MFLLGVLVGIIATIVVNAIGKSLKLWGNRQIVGREDGNDIAK